MNDWHRIAWAFIRPIGSNGITNTGKKIRLQLYKPGPKPKSFHKSHPTVGFSKYSIIWVHYIWENILQLTCKI